MEPTPLLELPASWRCCLPRAASELDGIVVVACALRREWRSLGSTAPAASLWTADAALPCGRFMQPHTASMALGVSIRPDNFDVTTRPVHKKTEGDMWGKTGEIRQALLGVERIWRVAVVVFGVCFEKGVTRARRRQCFFSRLLQTSPTNKPRQTSKMPRREIAMPRRLGRLVSLSRPIRAEGWMCCPLMLSVPCSEHQAHLRRVSLPVAWPDCAKMIVRPAAAVKRQLVAAIGTAKYRSVTV